MNRLPRHWPLLLLFSVALFSLWICARVEVLNSRAGSILPMVEEGKWRAIRVEVMWRRMNGLPLDYTLTQADRARMEQHPDFPKWNAWNDLRDFLRGFGVIQYLIVPIIFILGLIGFFQAERLRWLLLFPVLAAVIAGYRMVTLSYLGSLGW